MTKVAPLLDAELELTEDEDNGQPQLTTSAAPERINMWALPCRDSDCGPKHEDNFHCRPCPAPEMPMTMTKDLRKV